MKNALTLAALALTLTLAGCGGSETTTDDPAAAAARGEAGAAGRGEPGGSGEVVDVTESTAQVQNEQGQVAVTWTDDTTFTQQVDADLAAVTVGACVMVQSDGATDEDTSDDSVAAATVRITEASDDGCVGGGRGARPNAARGEGPGGERPDAERPGGNSTAPGGAGRGGGGGTFGEVTAVSADGFTVSAQRAGADEASDLAVTVSSGTSFSTTAEASASDVAVGRCITSGGDADDTGAITATTLAISDPIDDACTTGFGGGRPQASS